MEPLSPASRSSSSQWHPRVCNGAPAPNSPSDQWTRGPGRKQRGGGQWDGRRAAGIGQRVVRPRQTGGSGGGSCRGLRARPGLQVRWGHPGAPSRRDQETAGLPSRASRQAWRAAPAQPPSCRALSARPAPRVYCPGGKMGMPLVGLWRSVSGPFAVLRRWKLWEVSVR